MANSGARPWDVGAWLRGLGLAQYEASFRENAIDTDILRDLTDQDLEKLEVLLGDRRRLLRAIAALGGTPASTSTSAAVAEMGGKVARKLDADEWRELVGGYLDAALEVSGERRYVTVMFCDLVDSTGIAARLDG